MSFSCTVQIYHAEWILKVHWDLNHFIMKAMCLFTGFGISSKMWDYPFGTLIKDWHWCADPASTLPCLWALLSFRNRLMTCSFLSLLYNLCRGIYIKQMSSYSRTHVFSTDFLCFGCSTLIPNVFLIFSIFLFVIKLTLLLALFLSRSWYLRRDNSCIRG